MAGAHKNYDLGVRYDRRLIALGLFGLLLYGLSLRREPFGAAAWEPPVLAASAGALYPPRSDAQPARAADPQKTVATPAWMGRRTAAANTLEDLLALFEGRTADPEANAFARWAIGEPEVQREMEELRRTGDFEAFARRLKRGAPLGDLLASRAGQPGFAAFSARLAEHPGLAGALHAAPLGQDGARPSRAERALLSSARDRGAGFRFGGGSTPSSGLSALSEFRDAAASARPAADGPQGATTFRASSPADAPASAEAALGNALTRLAALPVVEPNSGGGLHGLDECGPSDCYAKKADNTPLICLELPDKGYRWVPYSSKQPYCDSDHWGCLTVKFPPA